MTSNIHTLDQVSYDFDAAAETERLNSLYDQNSAEGALAAARERFGDKLAIVSSFGSESAALLHIASNVDKSIPVIFLDTGKLFGETKGYRDDLAAKLGLTDVRIIKPNADSLKTHDPKGALWTQDTDSCCFHRKVLPLKQALDGFDAWASGRKRFHAGERTSLRQFDHSDGRVKVNPLAYWNHDEVEAYIAEKGLPKHPLVTEGFKSIGCMPCTDRAEEGEDVRAGRWRGRAKSECGIHLSFASNVARMNKISQATD